MKRIKSENPLCHDSGFTLIEAMIALVVLLVGILGVMGMQYYAITGNTSSREMRIATSTTFESIEQTKAMPYANLASGTDAPFVTTDTTITGGLTSFVRRWWVVSDCLALNTSANADPCSAGIAATCSSDPDSTTTVAVSAIRARTCWQDKNGGFHSISIDSLRWDENVVP